MLPSPPLDADRRPPAVRLFACALALAAVAGAYGGWNAWREQQARTYPLDLDGWGHLAARLKDTGNDFAALFAEPSLWKGPVVPFVFGLGYHVAPYDESILALNVAAFAGAVAVLFLAFCSLGAGPRTAAAALLLWVFFLPHQYLFGYYFAEPLLALFVSLAFALTARAVRKQSPAAALAAGAAAGLLLLSRAPYLLALLGLALLAAYRLRGARARVLAPFALGLLLTFLPWGVRNYLVYHEVIPFTTEGGKIVFQGSYLPGDDAEMNTLRQGPEFAEIEGGERGQSPVEQYRYWKGLAFAQIKQDPAGQLRLCLRKAARFWVYLPQHSWRPGWKTAAAAAAYLPLALLGFVRARRSLLAQMCAVWVAGLWLFHALVHSEMRYNFPVLPMAFLLAVIGANGVWARLAAARWWAAPGKSRQVLAGA